MHEVKHVKILPGFLIEGLVPTGVSLLWLSRKTISDKYCTANVRPKTTISIFLLNQNHLHDTRLEVCVGNSRGFCHEEIYILATKRAYRPYIIYIAIINLEFVAMFSSSKKLHKV